MDLVTVKILQLVAHYGHVLLEYMMTSTFTMQGCIESTRWRNGERIKPRFVRNHTTERQSDCWQVTTYWPFLACVCNFLRNGGMIISTVTKQEGTLDGLMQGG